MKKLLLIIFISFSFTSLFSQNLDFTVTTHKTQSNDGGKIIISITKGDGVHIFILFTDAPWKGGSKIEDSGLTTTRQYTFTKLTEGNYFVMVTDKNKANGTYKYVKVSSFVK